MILQQNSGGRHLHPHRVMNYESDEIIQGRKSEFWEIFLKMGQEIFKKKQRCGDSSR